MCLICVYVFCLRLPDYMLQLAVCSAKHDYLEANPHTFFLAFEVVVFGQGVDE
jgi:hypothetical protein